MNFGNSIFIMMSFYPPWHKPFCWSEAQVGWGALRCSRSHHPRAERPWNRRDRRWWRREWEYGQPGCQRSKYWTCCDSYTAFGLWLGRHSATTARPRPDTKTRLFRIWCYLESVNKFSVSVSMWCHGNATSLRMWLNKGPRRLGRVYIEY